MGGVAGSSESLRQRADRHGALILGGDRVRCIFERLDSVLLPCTCHGSSLACCLPGQAAMPFSVPDSCSGSCLEELLPTSCSWSAGWRRLGQLSRVQRASVCACRVEVDAPSV